MPVQLSVESLFPFILLEVKVSRIFHLKDKPHIFLFVAEALWFKLQLECFFKKRTAVKRHWGRSNHLWKQLSAFEFIFSSVTDEISLSFSNHISHQFKVNWKRHAGRLQALRKLHYDKRSHVLICQVSSVNHPFWPNFAGLNSILDQSRSFSNLFKSLVV